MSRKDFSSKFTPLALFVLFVSAILSSKSEASTLSLRYEGNFEKDYLTTELFIYNSLTERVTYVEMKPLSEGLYGADIDVTHLSHQFISNYRIGLPSKRDRRYLSFSFYFGSPQSAEIWLNPRSALKSRSQMTSQVRLRPFGDPRWSEHKADYQRAQVFFDEKNYSEALVYFDKSKSSPEVKEAAIYFSGLCHLNLGHAELAKKSFNQVAEGRDPLFAVYARYQLAIEQIKQGQLTQAQREISSINASDATPAELREDIKRLSEQLIPQKERYQDRLEKKWGGYFQFDFFNYDSNIPSLPGSLSPASNNDGVALGAQWGAWYYAFMNEEEELSLNYSGLGDYHLDRAFSAYDLWGHFVSARYTQKSSFNGQALRWSITPGLGMLQADVSGGDQFVASDSFMNTYFIQNLVAFHLNEEQWIKTTFDVGYNQDESGIYSVNDDPSGLSLKLSGAFNEYLNEAHTRSYNYGVNFEWIDAKGDNFKQLNPGFFVGGETEIPWAIHFQTQLSLDFINYYDSTNDRSDQHLTLDFGFTKYFENKIWASQKLSFEERASSQDVGRYSRFKSITSIGINF